MIMFFSSWHSFWQMGGYADYVWPAYGIAFLILISHVILLLRKQKKILKKLRKEHASSS